MKRSLGRLIVLILLGANGWGGEYVWHLVKSPSTLHVGESALVQYDCAFKGSAAEYSVKLNLKETPQYGIRMLSQQDRVIKGDRLNTFNLLITPKQTGRMDVRLGGTVEYVSPGSIDYTAHLGRDNVSQRDVVVTKTLLPSFGFEALPNTAALVGNITMEVRTDKTEVRAHEPLHLSLILKGSGNLDAFGSYPLQIPGVKIFSEPPQYRLEPSSQGYTGEVRQEFALVADRGYTIPPIALNVFDTAQNRAKTLRSAPFKIAISEGYDPLSLLDTPNIGDKTAWKRYGLYLSLIALGAGLGEGGRWLWRRRPRRKTKARWDGAKTAKELAVLLALSGEKRYEPIIAEVENGSIGLSEAKKKLATLTTAKEVKQ